MRKKFFSCLLLGAMCVGFSPTWAEQPEAVNVFLNNGVWYSTKFDNFKNLALVGDNVELQIVSETNTFAMNEVANIVIGAFIEDNTVGLKPVSATDLRVFRRDDCGVIESNAPIQKFIVFGLAGQIVCTQTLGAETYNTTFPVNEWMAGIYLVRVETENSINSFKLIIK